MGEQPKTKNFVNYKEALMKVWPRKVWNRCALLFLIAYDDGIKRDNFTDFVFGGLILGSSGPNAVSLALNSPAQKFLPLVKELEKADRLVVLVQLK